MSLVLFAGAARTTITVRRACLVPTADNFEKHKGKRFCKEDVVSLLDLKIGNTFIKNNCKHLQLSKLWIGRKQHSTVVD